MAYIDITERIIHKGKQKYKLIEQKYYIDDKRNKYKVDGKYVVLKPTEREIEVANMLGEILGGEVRLIPVVLNPKHIETSDYIINKEKFDLKEIYGNGKNTLDTAISKKKEQANNFIYDITKTQMKEIEQIEKIYASKHRQWVNKIVLIENKKILKIYSKK